MQQSLTHGNEGALTAHCHVLPLSMSLCTHFHSSLCRTASMQGQTYTYDMEIDTWINSNYTLVCEQRCIYTSSQITKFHTEHLCPCGGSHIANKTDPITTKPWGDFFTHEGMKYENVGPQTRKHALSSFITSF